MAIKVKLRQKPISGNRQALYLDFYPPIPHPESGKPTRRDFLNMFLFNEIKHEQQIYIDEKGKQQKRIIPLSDKNGNPKKIKLDPLDKIHNDETLKLAKQIRQKRENELNKPEIYTGYEKEQLKIREKGEHNFVEYFKGLADKRKASNHENWMASYNYLEKFTHGNLKFSELDEKFCNDFKEYLQTTNSIRTKKTMLANNSALSYFNKLKAVLKQAYKDGYLQTELNSKIEPIKEEETSRNFLTLEELNALAKIDCQNPVLKCAGLFSALTGLRFCDIKKMVWGEIEFIKNDGYYIKFKQQKTKGIEMMPISDQAYSFLGERKEDTDLIFNLKKTDLYSNDHLSQWIEAAGITKKFTFHCFRHTFATLQLMYGTDFYTVSKMLGNRELKSAQVYTKVVNQLKREAADRIKLNL